MADHTIAADEIAVHEIALSANVVETFKFATSGNAVEIFSHDGAAPIYATINGDNPTIKGADCFLIPGAMGSTVLMPSSTGPTVLKLISSGTPVVSVTRADRS